MPLDPKRHFSKRRARQVESVADESIPKPLTQVPSINQNKIEAQNLEKLKKSLRELILEKEGGSTKKLKTFALK